jgi:OmpA-OmpF porin, OOP family
VSRVSSWQSLHDRSRSRLPGPDNIRWWALLAFFLALILHVALFLVLGKVRISEPFVQAQEIAFKYLNMKPIEVDPSPATLEPNHEDTPPPPTTKDMGDQVDLLAKLPDQEIKISPEVTKPEFSIKLTNPAQEGSPTGAALAAPELQGFDVDNSMPELGRKPNRLPISPDGQVVVDPGAALLGEESAMDKFTTDLVRKGAGGRAAEGSLDGMVSLDDMVGLPSDAIISKRTMLPSDLLFEYNSAELRKSARVGLMKLALIIETHPKLNCWIEGYADTFGGEEFNLDLSQRRANAVRDYLVKVLKLPAARIAPIGMGKAHLIIPTGTVEQQGPNRRVEIKMRKEMPTQKPVAVRAAAAAGGAAPPKATAAEETPPAPQPSVEKPKRAVPVEEDPPTDPSKPILVKPKRALPVDEEPAEEPLKAQPVQPEPSPQPLKALPADH